MTPCGCSTDNKGIWTQHVSLLAPSLEWKPSQISQTKKPWVSSLFTARSCSKRVSGCLWFCQTDRERFFFFSLSLILHHKSERAQELTSVCVWGWLDLSRCRLVENRRVNSSRLNVHFHCSVFPAYFNPPMFTPGLSLENLHFIKLRKHLFAFANLQQPSVWF